MALTERCTREFLAVLIVFVSVNVLSTKAVSYSEIRSDELGHVRDRNGKIKWTELPRATYNGLDTNAPVAGWEITVKFARSVINAIQTQDFPYDLIRRIIKGQYAETEIQSYVVNVAIGCFTGALLILFLLICVSVYVRHEWRRRHKQVYFAKKPTIKDRSYWILIGFGYIFTVLNLIFILCLSVVSVHLHTGVLDLDNRIYGAMDDVATYFNTTRSQYNFVTSSTNQWFNNEVMQSDLQQIGYLVWQPGRDSFLPKVSSIFQSISDLDDRTSNAYDKIFSVNSKLTSIINGLGYKVRAVLSRAHYNLTSVLTDRSCQGCDGSCSGCQKIVADDIHYQTDFSVLPSVTDTINKLKTLMANPVSGSLQSPEYYYNNGLSELLKSRYSSAVKELQIMVDRFSQNVRLSTSSLIFPSEKTMYFNTLRKQFGGFHQKIVTGDTTRYGFTWLFSLLNFFGCIASLASLTLIAKEKIGSLKGEESDYHIPRCFLVCLTIGCIVLALGFMSVAIVDFYAGANLEKVACQPSKDLSIVKNVIDVPDTVSKHSGYFMGSIILGNGTYELKGEDIYRSCKKNTNAYTTFHHNVLEPDIYEDLNYSKPFENSSNLFDQLKLNVNLLNVSLVPAEYETWRNNFLAASYFNYTPFDVMLNDQLFKANISSFVSNLLTVSNTKASNGGPNESAKNTLAEVGANLKSLIGDIKKLINLKAGVLTDFNAYKAEVSHIKTVTAQVLTQLRSVEGQLQSQSASFLKQGADAYRNTFMASLRDFTSRSQKWVDRIGLCQPIADAYDSAVYGFCDNMADFENAEWMLVGNNVFILLVLLFLAIIILYYLPDESTFEDITMDGDFESVFGNGSEPDGLINKALYRVKKVFRARRPSQAMNRKANSSQEINTIIGDPLLDKNPDALQMKTIPNGDVAKAQSGNKVDVTDGPQRILVSPQPLSESNISINGSASSLSKMAVDTSKGNVGSGSSGKSAVPGSSMRPGTIVVSEVHPQPNNLSDIRPDNDIIVLDSVIRPNSAVRAKNVKSGSNGKANGSSSPSSISPNLLTSFV